MSVREIREKAGITQAQLAQEANVDIHWLQKIERNEIAIEDITLCETTRLFRTLAQYEDDPIIAETYSLASRIYREMRILLREAAQEVAAENE